MNTLNWFLLVINILLIISLGIVCYQRDKARAVLDVARILLVAHSIRLPADRPDE